MRHASDPSRMRVHHMYGLLRGYMENAHILNESLRVGERVIDVLPLVIVVIVLQVGRQFGQRPTEHIIQRLGLKIKLKEVDDVAIPEHKVILASGFELA